MTGTPTRSPGRPRSEASRQAILAAAIALAVDVGYAGLTIEGIAARAGVGKQTIYRWWPSRADVLLEASAVKADLHVPVADQGSYRADLRAFLRASYAMAGHVQFADLLRALMAEAQLDRDFGERFRVSFLERRKDALAVITDRARERGDLPEHPGADTVADIVFGTIWYRILATRRPLDEAWVDELIAVLAPGGEPAAERSGAAEGRGAAERSGAAGVPPDVAGGVEPGLEPGGEPGATG